MQIYSIDSCRWRARIRCVFLGAKLFRAPKPVVCQNLLLGTITVIQYIICLLISADAFSANMDSLNGMILSYQHVVLFFKPYLLFTVNM
jgi:hypothetical protein